MTQRNGDDGGCLKSIQHQPISRRSALAGAASGAATGLLANVSGYGEAFAAAPGRKPRPHFSNKIEDFVYKNLPAGKVLGTTTGVAQAPNGDVFVLQHFVEEEGPSEWVPPVEKRLPYVVHASRDGKFINAWGGPDSAPTIDGVHQWPEGPDNIEIDAEGNVWIFGYAGNMAALCYSQSGKFLKQFGQQKKPGSDDDTNGLLNGPISCSLDVKSREILFADGYRNHRIIGFDVDTGKFTRMWGAYGKPVSATPRTVAALAAAGSNQYIGSTLKYTDSSLKASGSVGGTPRPPEGIGFAPPIHKILRTKDGRLYAADRPNGRVQEFEVTPTSVRYIREVWVANGTRGMGAAWDVGFTPDEKFMLVCDGSNQRIWIVDRESFAVVGWSNPTPETEGDDNIAATARYVSHRFAIEPNGDLLLVRTRQGIQRLKYLGIS